MIEDRKAGGKDTLQNIILENRSRLNVSGVNDVDSFNESSIVLYTMLGVLTVKGGDLHINKLNIDIGELVIEGEIDSLVYSDHGGSKSSGGFFAKLFK